MLMNNPGIETQKIQYYDHNQYQATYYALYIALEKWIASLVFKGDLSRVYLASPEYAYRRRFELTDTSIEYNSVAASSLRFPFANYWPLNTGWIPDTRVASNTASLMYAGIYDASAQIRAMAVTTDINIVFHFDREDDARLAYETLLWQAYQERQETTTIGYSGEVLGIPLGIKVKQLQFNPQFKEKNWLEENRVFTIVATVALRSYSLYPLRQFADSAESLGVFYLTEEVILDFLTSKSATQWSVKSLFDYNSEIVINQLGANTTSDSATISWDVPNITKTTIEYNGVTYEVTPPDTSFVLQGLLPGSNYAVSVTFLLEGETRPITKTATVAFATQADGSYQDTSFLVGTNW